MPCLGYRENVSPSVYGYLASHYAMREGSEMLKHSAWFRYVVQLIQDPRVPDTKYHWYQEAHKDLSARASMTALGTVLSVARNRPLVMLYLPLMERNLTANSAKLVPYSDPDSGDKDPACCVP